MALPGELQRFLYPLAAYNFRVTVDMVSMSFSEISGLAIEYNQVTYRHGLSFLEGETMATIPFDRFSAVTCMRGTILGSDPLFLHRWLTLRDARSMEVMLCESTGIPVISWKIRQAVPVMLQAPKFAANTNEVSIDTVKLMVRGVSVQSFMNDVGSFLQSMGR